MGGESPGTEHKTKIQNNDLQLAPSCSVVLWFYSTPWGRCTQTPEVTEAVIKAGMFSQNFTQPRHGEYLQSDTHGNFDGSVSVKA